jgi:rfaE bifunctional protein nucleotidyltransferase chain/domain/rfaE bifunctional protein kinase chain/domain
VRVLVLGDALLDRDVLGTVERVAPDAPVPVVEVDRTDDRPGGAGLAARLLAGRGAQVTLASCAGGDPAGERLRELLADAGVATLAVAATPATRVLTRVRAGGQSVERLDDRAPALAPDAAVDAEALDAAVAAADAVLVADYGGGITAHGAVREVLSRWAARRPVVWDPHPRGAQPVPGVTAATPNRREALHFAGTSADGDLDGAAAELRERWQARAVVATDGAAGAVTVLAGSPPLFTPTPFASAGDTCGAGDRFAGTLTLGLARGAVITEAVGEAVVDVAGWLDAGGVAALAGPVAGHGAPAAAAGGAEPLDALLARVRGHGGRVVATGGCFDVLHAGHVACLEAARQLGDALVVLLNSDDSVRRLKGPERPVHTQDDRARVLLGLGCVDAVVVFDEDSPHVALDRLRPDVWAKGGDYAAATLPEASLVRSWGGRVVLLPYLPGRSTTRIIEHAQSSRGRAS